jgi:hypothetical protein
MAVWWSSKADGKNFFYKLPEHLSTHYKTWLKHRQTTQSMIASEPQRRHNEKRIHSIQHIAHVLDAAHINQPGIAITHDAMEDVEQSNIQSSSNEIAVIDATDFHMQDPIPPMPEQLVEQEIYQPHHNVSCSGNPNTERQYSPLVPPMGSFEMASVMFSTPCLLGSSSSYFLSTGQSFEGRKQWQCSVCKAARRDGLNCPERSNRKKCMFAIHK